MSRLIIKNLPAYTTDTSLRAHFAAQPSSSSSPYTITDARIARRPDGTSRRFAFVGYKTPDEASRAREWFDRTYVDGSRITVDVVTENHESKNRKRPSAPTPAPTSPPAPQPQPKKDAARALFLATMAPKPHAAAGRTWADDVLPLPESNVAAGAVSSSKKTDRLDKAVKGKKDKLTGAGTDADADPAGTPNAPDEESEARAEGLSDLEWMRRRMTRALQDEAGEKVFSQSDEEDPADEGGDANEQAGSSADLPAPAPAPAEADRAATRALIRLTGRLFLRNLAYTCTAAELEGAFGAFGPLSQVHLPLTPARTPSGLAFLTFSNPADAVRAWEALDGRAFQGRLLHVLGAVDQRPRADGAGGQDGPKVNLKEKRMEERKKGSAGWDWGVMYMNSDAVAAAVAARMGVDKAEILNAEEGNAAVKLALAETQVVQETKAYLESNGVNLDAFSAHPARSRTTILVKNLPAFTTAAQIRALFEPHGALTRVLVPPSGTLAVVEFADESEAGVAWRAVSYRRFGNAVLYLEKAPAGMWKAGVPAAANAAAAAPALADAAETAAPIALPAEQEPESAAPGSTLYIKNLSFSTTTPALTAVFRTLPGFVYARVQTKPAPNNKSQSEPEQARLSMGYGFAGFGSREDAERARTAMDGVVCEGHKLSVRFAGRGREDELAASADAAAAAGTGIGTGIGGKKTAKMIVKNVPFEASKADLRALFAAYGTLKSLRLPTKFDRRTRGFAFLEFVSRREAEAAMGALRHTHLLGRHLVLEWAEEELGVGAGLEKGTERVRERIRKAYGDGREVPSKKRKLEIGEGAQGEDEE